MEKEQILRYHRDEWLFVAAGVADAVVLPFYDERFHLSHAHKVMLHRVETPFGADVPNQDGKPAVPAQGHKELLDNVIQLFHKLGIAGTPGKVILMRRAPHISGVRDQIMVGRVEKNQICRIVHFVPQRIPSANTAGRGGIEVIQKRAHTKALRRRLARPRAGHRIKERIGTGPYVLTDFVTDEYAVFERNENYWGEAPAIQKITVKVIPDNQTRIMALENEEIDLIFGKNMLDADAISQYVDSDRFTVSLSDPTSTRHIVLNTTHDILGDTAVRKALQHATNRQAISEGIFYGLEPAADTLYSPTVPYCDVDLEPYAYDTEEAARLLDEAGWVMGSDGGRSKNGQKLELDLLYNSDSVTEKTISEYLQSEYLKLGISLNIHGEEEQSYRDNMKAGNFDMVFNICWGMPYDPQSSLAAMRAPVYGDYAAQQGLEDKAEIDQAITDILTSTDEAERQELYDFVLTRLHEDAVYIPLTYETNKALYTSELKGVHFGTDQYDVDFASMYFE